MSRKISATLIFCGLAFGVSPMAAWGQTEPFLPVPPVPVSSNVPVAPGVPLERGQTVVDRARPEVDPLGLHLGSFFLYPRVEVDEAYNDNIFATQTAKTGDFITLLAPSFDLRSNFNQNALNLSAGLTQSLYADHSTFNTTDAFVAGDGRLDVDANHDLHGSLRAERLHFDPGASPTVPGNATEPLKYTQYTATTGFQQARLRVGYSADLTARRQEYEAEPALGGTLISNSQLDNFAYEAALRAYYEFVPNYQGFVRGAYNIRNYDHAFGHGTPILDSQGFRVDVGARVDLTGITFAEGYVGYLEQDYRAGIFGSIGGVDVGGRLVWNVTQLTSISMNAERTVQDANTAAFGVAGAGAVSPGFLQSLVGVRVDHELVRNLLLNAHASYINDDFKGVAETDSYYQLGVGAKYLLNRYLYLGPSYTYQRHAVSGTPLFNVPFTQNIFLLRLSTQL